jgi:L-asparaginase/Glu-tRNA(Gln) amidotransferase subunit D
LGCEHNGSTESCGISTRGCATARRPPRETDTDGSGAAARALGVVSGEDLDGLEARMLLVALLATTTDPATIQGHVDRLSGGVR